MTGLYIHIPFCSSRCIYCDFYSTTNVSFQDRYTDCLCREIELRKGFFQRYDESKEPYSSDKTVLNTVYIGGGTPSQLSLRNIERIFQQINEAFVLKDAELTMEVNPDDVEHDLVSVMKQVGINRVSMGVQTFDDKRLKFLRRRHNSEQAMKAVATVKDAGIDNISIDLMFGFPEETINDWTSDIKKALDLNVKHISSYSLSYEKDTLLYNMWQRGEVKNTDDDTYANMYERLLDLMNAADYEHYEISNFARKGFRSRHNSIYWHDDAYLGIGAAAHSYNHISRQWNIADLQSYMKSIENGTLPLTSEHIDENTHYNDLITTALRTIDGLNTKVLTPQQQQHLMKAANRYVDNGQLSFCDNVLRLTRKGLYVSDMIMSDLMII